MPTKSERIDYEDGMYVQSIGDAHDRGRVIGFALSHTRGIEYWTVERPDGTVFTRPRVQLARLWRAEAFDGSRSEQVVHELAEGKSRFIRTMFKRTY